MDGKSFEIISLLAHEYNKLFALVHLRLAANLK